MNLRQFLSGAAAAAVMMTSVFSGSVTAQTSSGNEPSPAKVLTTSTTIAGISQTNAKNVGAAASAPLTTTTAPMAIQAAAATTTTVATILYMDGPEGTGAGPNVITVPATTFKSKKALYDSKNNNKLKPNDGKYEVEVDRYDNIELYFSTDKKENVEIGTTDISEPGEERLCRYASVYDKEKEANKLVLHGDVPGTQDYYIEDHNGNSCIINVTVKDRELPKANRELRTKADEYGSNGTYFYNTDDDFIEITFTNAKDYVFANTITSSDSSVDIYAARGYEGTFYPCLGIDIKGVGTTQAYVVDTEGKSCIVTINVKEPAVTSSVVSEPKVTTSGGYSPVYTTTSPYENDGGSWTGHPGTANDVITYPFTTPVGTGGWNPPPYMVTDVNEYYTLYNNNELQPETNEITVDQYSVAKIKLKGRIISDHLYPKYGFKDEICDCLAISGEDKGTADRIVIYGMKPGTVLACFENSRGENCFITITVKEKSEPVVNDNLYPVNVKDDTITLDGTYSDYYRTLTFTNFDSNYIFAQVLEGKGNVHFEFYKSSLLELNRHLAIEAFKSGTYKILLTDDYGQNRLITAVTREKADRPVETDISDSEGETALTSVSTTYDYSIGTANDVITDVPHPTTAATTTTPVEGPTEDYGEPTLLGDVDLSGDLGISDITALAKHLLGSSSYPLSKQAKANSDMDKNKWVDVLDLSMLIERNLNP